jgi:MoaA/NifB/PqqE/SkfB family radical SAM enzyme
MSNAELMGRFLGQGWRRRADRGGPVFVTMFVTSRCNSRCGHCFYLDTMIERKGAGELTLDEYRAVARSMPPFTKLLVSGGEPFIRRDLPEILDAFYQECGVGQFTIPTNATFPDRIADGMSWLASRAPRAFVQVQISIDGVGEDHDRVRKTPGNFAKLVQTWEKLRAAQERHPNIDIIFNFTLTKYTVPVVRDVCEFLDKDLGTKNLHMNMVRGSPHEPETLEVTPEQHAEAVATVAEFFGSGKGRRDWQSEVFGRLFAARKAVTMGRIHGVAGERGDVPYVPCKAGLLNVVLQEQGDVHACELIDRPLGNLRDVGLDFMKIWDGDELRSFREQILADRCTCTHETNVSTNFYFSLPSYARLARELVRRGA